MKIMIKQIIVCLFKSIVTVLSTLIFVLNIYAAVGRTTEKPSILVTSVPLASLVGMVARDSVTIKVLENMTGCIHHLHLTPKDIELIKSQDLIIYSSDILEPIVKKFPNPNKLEIVSNNRNRYFWLDFVDSIPKILEQISIKFGELFPKNSALYHANYLEALLELKSLKEKIESLPRNQKDILIILDQKALVPMLELFDVGYIYKNPTYMQDLEDIIFLLRKGHKVIITEHERGYKFSKENRVEVALEKWNFKQEDIGNIYFQNIMKIMTSIFGL